MLFAYLKDAGVLEIGGSRLNTSYRLLLGAPRLKSIDAKPKRREVPKYLRPVFRHLAQNCARKGGLYSCTQDDIARTLGMPVLTVVDHIGALKKETFIGIIRHAFHNAYFIVGKEPDPVVLNEPSALSIPGRILKEVRREVARASDGLCKLTRTQIAKKTGNSLVSVNHAMADLRHKHFFPVINRGERTLWASYSVVPAPKHKSELPAAQTKRGRGKPHVLTPKLERLRTRLIEMGWPPLKGDALDELTKINHPAFAKLNRRNAKTLKARKRYRDTTRITAERLAERYG